MGQAEYIVRFKGDYSALESDLKKINGATKKLEDDEVIIKLNYDGNIKEFNKVFDSISKQHPELGIQFQYNVNEKLLNQELDKLEKYTQLKLDIDEGNIQSKLEKMGDDIGLALQNHLDAKDIRKLVENYFGYYNTAIKAGAKHINIDEINNRLSEAFEIESKDIKQIFDDIFESGKSETLQLFKFDKSLNDDLLATKERIEDIRNVLKLLKEKGASETGLPSELQKVQDEIKILRSDIQEMQEQLKDLSGEAFTRMSENIKETNRQLDITKERLKVVQDFLKNNGNSEVLNFTEALNKLQGMLSTFYKENNGNHVSSFWDELIQKAQDGDKEVLQLLSDLRLLKDDNLPNKVNAGMVKSGGLIGDDYTVLTTKIRSNKFSGDRLKDAEELKNRLDAISNSGVNAARTLAIVSDEANNLFVEIQQTAPGKMLGQIYGQTDKDWVNMDFLKAEDEEILKLIVDLETLRKAGIGVELNAGNLLYQKGKGFSIIDMDLKPLQDYEETISESQDVLLDSIRQFFEEQTDETGNIKAEAQEAINALDSFSDHFGAIAKEKRELIDKLSTEGANNNQILINDAATEATKEAADAIKKAQDSNSPAELTKPLGQNFTEGYAEGIREAIPEVVQACKEVVLAAYNAMKEAGDSENGETVDLSESFVSGFRKNLENALPTIQEELQKILSKINVNDDTYTNVIGIGQELIDSIIVGIKNEHSAESFKETIEQVITDAFSNIVLDRATKAIVQQIQSYIDSYTSIDPFVIENFDVNTNSIVISIQDALNSNKFNINLDGTIQELASTLNTSADNVRMSFIDAIDWMRQANEWQKLNDKDATHERGLWFNSKTGQFSNPTVVGNEHSVGYDISKAVLDYYKSKGIVFDTDLHSHQDYDYAAPSPNHGDLGYFFKHVFENNINKFIVMAQKEFAVFDFSKLLVNSREELEDFFSNWISENIDKVRKESGNNSYTMYDSHDVKEYISSVYTDLWEYIRDVLYEDIRILGIGESHDAINAMFKHFGYGDNSLTSLLTGEVSTSRDIFAKLYDKTYDKIAGNNDWSEELESRSDDMFDGVMALIMSQFEEQMLHRKMGSVDKNTLKHYLFPIIDKVFSDEYFKDIFELKDEFKDQIFKYMSTELLNSQYSRFDFGTDAKRAELFQEAGSMAMKFLSGDDNPITKDIVDGYQGQYRVARDLISKFVKYYNTEEFEKEFGKGVTQSINKQTNHSPALPEDLQQQLQGSIDESGKYIIKVYGELIDNFKSELQQAINELGSYVIEIRGELTENFRSDLIRDMESYDDSFYYINIMPRLFETFKEVLQEAIDSLGAFPIEVKPYTRKGGEIEGVDSPGGNQNNLSSDTTSLPSQMNEITQAEDKMGNEAQEATNQAKQGLAEMREEAEKTEETIVGFRKYFSGNGFINTRDAIAWLSSVEEIAKTYKGDTLAKAVLDSSKILTVDAKGADFGNITYNGQKMDTDQIAEYARQLGYLGVQIKNVKDAAKGGDVLSDTIAIFNKDLILGIENAVDDAPIIIEKKFKIKPLVDWITHREGGESPLTNDVNNYTQEESEFANKYYVQYANRIGNLEETKSILNELETGIISVEEAWKKLDSLMPKFKMPSYADSLDPESFALYSEEERKFFEDTSDVAGRKLKAVVEQLESGTMSLKEAYEVLGLLDKIPNETPVSTESTNAETKALLSKKEVVEQLRTELNLTKKAAEDLFDQQGYAKTNNKYQIEQAAVEELIASLKKKQETEESTKPTQTSATATAMQEEVSVVNAAIEEEKKKFDELKNKISKTIPNAVKKKNEAFEQERDLVAKVVDDEVDYFDVLNNTINGVTNSIEKQYDVTKNAKPKLDTSDINPEETNKTDSTPESRKTKTTLLSLDKIEQKIREIGLSAQDTEKAIALLGGSKQSFSWMNSELEDQYDKVNALVEIFKKLGIVISSVENSDAWDTTISTNSILDFNKQKYQSVGQKSTIQQEMAEYYTQMQKEAEDIYAKAIQKTSGLTDKIAVLKNSGKYTQDFVNELTNAEKEVENLLNALKAGEVPLEEVDTKVTELANNIENTLAKKAFNDVKLAAEKSLTNVGLKIDQIIAKNSAMGEDFKQRFMTLRKELEDAKSVQAVQKIVAEVNKLESELIQAGKTGKSFIDQIKQRLRDINSKYIAQYFSFQDIIRYAREAFSAVQELNIQMVELAKVSEQSLSQIEDDFNSYANTAKDLGATISDTISATADWARMGYNVPDAKQLAEVALLYKNVGDGIDITAANQSLISTLQGYQMQADEAEHIVDVFNEVANNYAIDTAGIGEALQRSAASLDAANTSLEQSVALVTAANTVVQNPESVGTTFKTLSARLRGAKTDLEELGEEEDEFTQTTSKLQSLVKGLTGFDILEADQKTYKSIYDILVGIGKEWKNLTDIEQASLGEALFGKRNANVGFAILNNIDTLTSAYETAENAAGSARREQENYEKGIEYSVNKAKAALQELAFDALDSDLLKGLIDMGTNAINLLDTIIDKFGLLKTAIVGIAGVIGSQKLG